MFDIAYHSQGQTNIAAQAKDIAAREDIPLRYLEQIFQDLKRAGLVESKRGPRGGYFLKRDPSDISLADVVNALQGPVEELFVLESEAVGASSTICSRHLTAALWKDLANHVASWLNDLTLADLVVKGAELGVPRTGCGQPMYFI